MALPAPLGALDGRPVVAIDDFADWGLVAYVTTRAFGTLGAQSEEPARAVLGRWQAIVDDAAARGIRAFATAHQVHGARVHEHGPGWQGWLRAPEGDGHLWTARAHGAAVTVADCVPVFVAHPSGAGAVLHSGWRSTAAGITEEALARFAARGLAPADCRLHLGPAICGACYEVGPEVHAQVAGRAVAGPMPIDVRAEIAIRARAAGVRDIRVSPWCTRCHGDALFSHRAGDPGRQVGVLLSLPG
ncbi:MAG: polyphenol oxidase family protein [Gemmatimonadaceae bacterium]|nr:polyphenol oxidase family protein [Gemmatimonadaceae bacterium]